MLMRILAAALLAAAPGATGGDDDTIVMRDGTTRSGKVQAAEAAGCSLAVGKKTDTIAWTSISTVQYGGAKDFDSARQLLAEGKVPEGIAGLEKLAADKKMRAPVRQDVLFELARAYRSKGDDDKALETWRDLAKSYPNGRYLVSGGAWLVSALIARNDPGGALRAVDELTSDARGANADAAQVAALDLLRGRALEGQKKFPDAQSAYERVAAVKEMPADYAAAAQLGVARALQGAGKKDDAGKALPRAREASAPAVSPARGTASATPTRGRGRQKDVDALEEAARLPARRRRRRARAGRAARRSSSARSPARALLQALSELENNKERKAALFERAQKRQDDLKRLFPRRSEVRAAPAADSKPAEDRQEPSMAICELREEYADRAPSARTARAAGGDRAFAREGAPRARARHAPGAAARPPRARRPRAVEVGRPAGRGRARRAARAPPPPRAAREADRRADRQDRLRHRGHPLGPGDRRLLRREGQERRGSHRPRRAEAGAARLPVLHPGTHGEQRGERREGGPGDPHVGRLPQGDLGARRGISQRDTGCDHQVARAARPEPADEGHGGQAHRRRVGAQELGRAQRRERPRDADQALRAVAHGHRDRVVQEAREGRGRGVLAPLRHQAPRRLDRLRQRQREPAAPRAQPLLPGRGRAPRAARGRGQGGGRHQEPGRPQLLPAALQGGRRGGRPHGRAALHGRRLVRDRERVADRPAHRRRRPSGTPSASRRSTAGSRSTAARRAARRRRSSRSSTSSRRATSCSTSSSRSTGAW